MTLSEIRDEAEKLAIARALLSAGGIVAAAHKLGISYHTLRRRLKRFGLYEMKTDEILEYIRASESTQ